MTGAHFSPLQRGIYRVAWVYSADGCIAPECPSGPHQ